MNPFISFCLYVAARVFVQYLKSRPKDTQIRASLQFLLQAMQAIKRKNPLTESFLVQLDVDLEGAGIEGIKDLRKNAQPTPFTANRSEACPSEHLHMGHKVTYGDEGLSSYTDPNTMSNLTTTAPPKQTIPTVQSSFGYTDLSNMNEEHHMGFVASSDFSLPSRHRSPASGMHRSPQDMDLSPGGSGGSTGEHRTPNSSSAHNLSAHTSHTGYSPQNMQQTDQADPGRLTGPSLFDPNSNAFSTDFDMHSYPANAMENQQQGFVLPSNWSTGTVAGLTPGATAFISGGGGSGMTPGPTGMTPGASGLSQGMTPGSSGMSDMINMSDEAWNQMSKSTRSWRREGERMIVC